MSDPRRTLHVHASRLRLLRERRALGVPDDALVRRVAAESGQTVAAVLAALQPPGRAPASIKEENSA